MPYLVLELEDVFAFLKYHFTEYPFDRIHLKVDNEEYPLEVTKSFINFDKVLYTYYYGSDIWLYFHSMDAALFKISLVKGKNRKSLLPTLLVPNNLLKDFKMAL